MWAKQVSKLWRVDDDIAFLRYQFGEIDVNEQTSLAQLGNS